MADACKNPWIAVDRRGFLRGAATAGIGAAAAMPISTAVWAQSGSPSGKVLRARSYADLDALDPGFYENAYNVDVMNCIYSKLTHYKPGRTWETELQAAEQLEQVDPTHIHFKLKPGIMFTGGFGEMTADDVQFSFERIIKHDSPVKGDWLTLDHVEVTGKYSGVIVLKKPFEPLWNITLPYGAGCIVSKQAVMKATGNGGNFGMKPPAFSGPYILAEWKANQYTKLVRNPEWKGAAPGFDEIRILPIEDEQTAEIAYQAGDLGFTGVSLASLGKYKHSPPARTKVEEYPSLAYVWIGMNIDNPALKDINMRKAIQYAINLPQILQAAYFDQAKPATGLIAPGLLGHRKAAMVPPEGDLEKARAFLKKAGGPPREKLTIDTTNTSKWTTIAEVVQAQLKQIGIDLQVNVQDSASFGTLGMESKGDRWKKLQLIVNRFSMAPDPYYATEWFTTKQVGIWNWERFSSKEFDKLNEEAISESDKAKRAQMYRRMQDLMEESGAYRFVTHGGDPVMYHDNIEAKLRPDGRPLYRFFQTS